MTPNQINTDCENRTVALICRNIYDEVAEFYDAKAPEMDNLAMGFRILYGPPSVRVDLCFMGINPGGDLESMSDAEQQVWPNKSEYAVASWRLAKMIRRVWSEAELSRSTGLNEIFFRSPTVQQ